MYIIILNFENEQIECLDLCNMPKDMEADEYTETILDYSLTNCEWMVTEKKPQINFLN